MCLLDPRLDALGLVVVLRGPCHRDSRRRRQKGKNLGLKSWPRVTQCKWELSCRGKGMGNVSGSAQWDGNPTGSEERRMGEACHLSDITTH